MVNLYSLHDKKMKEFAPPFTAKNDVQAIRSMEIALESGDSLMKKFPKDFELTKIGVFEEEKGTIKPYHEPVVIAKPEDFIGLKPTKEGK